MTVKRIYCIPSNRDIKKTLTSYIREVKFAYSKFQERFPLIIIETNSGDTASKNQETINNLKVKYPDIWLIHFTISNQKKLFQDVFSDKFNYLQEHFMDDSKDYGKAMNKIFLIAALFGVDMIHRRDSDTFLLEDFDSSYENKFPIEMEIKYLGREICEIYETSSYRKEKFTVVGSNYYGEWNMAIKDFARKDFNLVYKLYELLGFDKSSIKEICDEAFQFEPPLPGKKLELTIIDSVNNNANPDCGNMAMYNLYNYYPMLDARSTLASDYFVMDLATAMDKPSLHHNRLVFHEYNQDRFKYQNTLDYWESVLKFCDYFNIYNEIYDGNLVNGSTTYNQVAQIVAKFSKKNKAHRRERMFKIVNEILLDFDENYTSVGTELLSRIPKLVDELNVEYDRHSRMIKDWPEIMNKCRNLDWRDYID